MTTRPSMDSGWYHQRQGGAHGPLSLEELVENLGRLQDWRNEWVWHPSIGDWRHAASLFHFELRQPKEADVVDKTEKDETLPSSKRWLFIIFGIVSLAAGAALLWRWLA